MNYISTIKYLAFKSGKYLSAIEGNYVLVSTLVNLFLDRFYLHLY